MKSFYRIVFAKNEIISCSEVVSVANELPYYEHKNGQLIFLLLEAENEADARAKALQIVDEIKQNSEQLDLN